MKQHGRFILSIFTIIVLLPYVLTVFIQGDKKEEAWEEYLLGELEREISPDAELEAMKAQAVIARTKIYKLIEEGEKLKNLYLNPKDIESMWSQDHYDEYYEKYKKAILETKHQVMKYKGEFIDASYHKLSAGNTRSSVEMGIGEEYGYLQKKECNHDKESKEFASEKIFNGKELQDLFHVSGLEKCQVAKQDTSGYALFIELNDKKFNAEDFCDKLGLPSSCIEITKVDDVFVFMTKGIGHGLGLSQYAAQKMAEEGTKYRDILNYFYTDIEIVDGGEIQK